jgi:hypothetical protein
MRWIVDKWTKRSAFIGGTWGLLSGMIYAWIAFAAGFSGHGDVGVLFKNVPIIFKIIVFPAYVTDIFSYLLGNSLIFIASLLAFYFFILWCIGMSILIGAAIGISVVAVLIKIGVIK